MKILSLDLIAFGPFTDLSLGLGDGREGLHIIYGPNEAGKSSALRAVRQLFFGIPSSSRDNFIHQNRDLRIGATVRTRSGETLEFVRRKGNKNTLLRRDDTTVLDDAVLGKFLTGIDEASFEHMFALDHLTLVEGGRAIVEGKGDIGQILFAAGAGLSGLRAVERDLISEAAELFAPRGSKATVNALLAGLEDARRRVRAAELPSSQWLEHDRALAAALDQKARVERQLETRQRERNRLQRIDQALPAITRRKSLLAALERCRDAALLPDEFAEHRREYVTELALAQSERREAVTKIEEIDVALASLQVPDAIVDQADAIEQLHRRLGSYQKAELDRSTRLAPELRQFLLAAQQIQRELRPDLDFNQVEQMRLTQAARVRVQQLGAQHDSISSRLATAEQDAQRLEQLAREAEESLDAMQPLRDPAELAKAIDRVKRRGDLDEQLDAARSRLRNLEEQAAVDIQKLPLWLGSLEQLEVLPVPTSEAVDEFRDRLGEADNVIAGLASEIQSEKERAANIERQIEQLEAEQAVPSEAELAEARRLRDDRWRLVRRAWEERDETETPEENLPAVYELSVRGADEISDRLRHEADRVARRAELEEDARQCQTEIESLGMKLERARQQHDETMTEWRRIWQACEIEPQTPKQMDAWLRQQHALVELARMIREQRRLVSDLDETIRTCQADLDREMATFTRETGDTESPIQRSRSDRRGRARGKKTTSEESPSPTLWDSQSHREQTLAATLDRATDLVEQVRRAAATREKLEADLQRYRRELANAERQLKRASDELTSWRNEWAEAIAPLGLRPQAKPAEANAVIERVTELFEKVRQAASHQDRMETISREATEFEADVRQLAERVATDIAHLPVDQLAGELHARLVRGRVAKAQRESLSKSRVDYAKKLHESERVAAKMTKQLELLCQEANVVSPDQLPQAEVRSHERQQIERQLGELNEQLARLSGGVTVEEFVESPEMADPDSIAPKIVRLDEEIAQYEEERAALLQTIGREREVLRQMDGSAGAAEAAEEMQMLVPKIQASVEQYVRLRLASAVLREAMERYRQKNQGPILLRASELFESLTLGSFESLRVDYPTDDDAKAVLLGVRSGTREKVDVEGMSEGTADQLYLALRIASLEAYFETHEPLPFIVDDLLVNFDNDRSAAALKVLGELSQRTQVLFFTHHEHLLDIARTTLDDSIAFIHTLASRPATMTG